MLNIVLVEPEIPENTGNISRTCSVTGARLHLVRPLGFSVDDKHLKRAGLDYWQYLDITYYDSFEEVEEKNPDARFFLLSTHATRSYADAEYRDGDFLVFGKETAGLGPELLGRRSADAVPLEGFALCHIGFHGVPPRAPSAARCSPRFAYTRVRSITTPPRSPKSSCLNKREGD